MSSSLGFAFVVFVSLANIVFGWGLVALNRTNSPPSPSVPYVCTGIIFVPQLWILLSATNPTPGSQSVLVLILASFLLGLEIGDQFVPVRRSYSNRNLRK